MSGFLRQVAVAGCLLLAGTGFWLFQVGRSERRVIEAGFWFEDVSFDSADLDGPLTSAEMETIASIARSELDRAFAGLRLVFSDRRDARYRVAVVQYLRDLRFRREVAIAGESRAVTGLGGSGAVSFLFLANGAVACAPQHASRASIIEAIGRGVGRAAVHEFAHQLLPRAAIHDSTDVRSYEYASAGRCEQYFGPMHWDIAWPLLLERLAR